MLARIHFTVRTTPGQHARRSTARSSRRALPRRRGAGPTSCATPSIDAEGEARGIELFKRWGAAFPPEYRERVRARGAVPDVRKIASLVDRRAARARALPAARRRRRRARLQALPARRHGGAVRLAADARAHGRARARRAACRASRRPTPRSSLHDFELQVQGAGEIEPDDDGAPVRGRLRARLPRRRRERRLQPPGAARRPRAPTRSWCCAPTPST